MDLDHDACYRALELRDARFDGRFFVAVKTTGIYCRPVCPARTPRSENVTFYSTAAAAQEAGFRPCLRCRPETAPDTGAWRGTSSTVSRALALIELGALDEGDVDALADRLGMGERQLRRLCRQHLGASPVAVAQTRRVLLAKQLIHETSLPMTEIAFAAGFGSIRRFNGTFRALFGRAPCALRRASPRGTTDGSGAAVSLLLRYQPPYDWPAMLEFLRLRAIAGIERVEENCYTRTIQLEGRQGIVSVRPAEGNALRASVRFPRLSALPASSRGCAASSTWPPIRLPSPPISPRIRLWRRWSRRDRVCACPAPGTASSWRSARCWDSRSRWSPRSASPDAWWPPMASRLAEPDRDLTHVFPRPEVLARADLTTLGMPRSRAATLSAVAAAVVADPDLFCVSRGLDQAIERLSSIRGVGEWTAHYIALRQLREPDAFPAADVGLMRALAHLEGRTWSSRELVGRAESWRPWRAYAAQHLWASAGLLRSSPMRSARPGAGVGPGIRRGGSNGTAR